MRVNKSFSTVYKIPNMECTITVLGTSSGIPTSGRSEANYIEIVNSKQEKFHKKVLVDAGEAVQQQLFKYNLDFDIDTIIITRDKISTYLGLPGLLQTMSKFTDKKQIDIIIPAKAEWHIENFLSSISPANLEYRLIPVEDSFREEFTTGEMKIIGNKHSVSLIFEEGKKRGKFNREKAENLDIKKSKFGKLCDGESVKNAHGETIHPVEVLGPEVDGIKVGISGQGPIIESVNKEFMSSDILIYECAFATENKWNNLSDTHRTHFNEISNIMESISPTYLILSYFQPDAQEYNLREKLQNELNRNTLIGKEGLQILVKSTTGGKEIEYEYISSST